MCTVPWYAFYCAVGCYSLLLIPAGFLPTIVLDTDSENEILILQTFRQLKTDAVKTEQLQASMNERIEYAVTKVRLEAQAVVRDLQDQLQKAKASCWKLEVQIKQYKEASTLAQGDGAKQLNNLNDGPSKEVGCLSEFAWSCHAHVLVADVCSTFVKWDLAVPLAWIMASTCCNILVVPQPPSCRSIWTPQIRLLLTSSSVPTLNTTISKRLLTLTGSVQGNWFLCVHIASN